MIKAARVQVEYVYEKTKNSNRLFNATLQLAENSVKYASEVDAVKMVLNSQLVLAANKMAVNGLDKIEQKYPIVNKTPGEVWGQSRLKKNVDRLYSAKDYTVAKINNTKKYATKTLDNVLDYSDTMIDKYVVVHNEANGEIQHCDANNSYLKRARCISGKFYHGVKYRAVEKYDQTKHIVLQLLALDMQMIMFLAESAKNKALWTIGTTKKSVHWGIQTTKKSVDWTIETAKKSVDWTIEKSQATLAFVREQGKTIWHEFQHGAERITGVTEIIVLGVVQITTSNVAAIGQFVADISSPYLPVGLEKKVMASAAYANELRDNFAKAKTLGDLRDEVVAETKENFAYVQDHLSNGIKYLINFSPISWLIPSRFKADRVIIVKKSIKVENGHVDKHQENGYIEDEIEEEIGSD